MTNSLLAIVGAAVLSQIIGFVWYGVFGNAWMRELGLRKHTMKKEGMWQKYLGSFVGSLIQGFVLWSVLIAFGVTTAMSGFWIGLVIGLGFIGTTIAVNYMFEDKSLTLYSIVAGHQIISSAIMGLFMGFFL